MKVSTKRVGNRILYAIRGINDNARRMIVVSCDTACPADCTVVLVDTLANRRVSVHCVGGGIGNCFVYTCLLQVPDADIVAPRVGILDRHAAGDVVAHVELESLRQLRHLDPEKRFSIVNPCVFIRCEAGAVFGEKGHVVSVSCRVGVVPRRSVIVVETRDAGFRDAHEDGEVLERLSSGVAGDLQLDRMVEVGHRQRIGGSRIERRKRGGEDEE